MAMGSEPADGSGVPSASAQSHKRRMDSFRSDQTRFRCITGNLRKPTVSRQDCELIVKRLCSRAAACTLGVLELCWNSSRQHPKTTKNKMLKAWSLLRFVGLSVASVFKH